MKNFYIGKIGRVVGGLRGRFGQRAAILMYHRITDYVSNPYLLCVTPHHFAEHLQVIRDIGYPMRLDELARGVRDGNLPQRAMCVTFDDGYADTLYTAKPLLERYDVPATVFMTTGTSGRSREFWWDELERIFLQPGCLPAHLQLDGGGQHFAWDLGDSSIYSEDDFHRGKNWTLLESSDPTPRHAVLRAVHELILSMGAADRQQVLDRLLNWAGMAPMVRATHRALEPDEIVNLDRGGIVEVGSHTVNHLALSTQPSQVQREEIQPSKADLEGWLEHAVRSFAYPHGLYTRESVAFVREVGFEYACACLYRPVRPSSDLFLLPRVSVFNWDGDEFACHLRAWIGC